MAAYAVKNGKEAISLADLFRLLDKQIKEWPIFKDEIDFAEEKLVYAGGELEILNFIAFI